jgi:hypothetical protein
MKNFDKGCRRALVAAGWKRADRAGYPPDYKPRELWLRPGGNGNGVTYQTAARRLRKEQSTRVDSKGDCNGSENQQDQ